MTNQCLLVLIATPEVEETLVDWLLGCEDLSGFSSQYIDGYSRSHQHLNLAEQVAGRRQHVMFHVHTDCATAEHALTGLRQAFAGAGLHYWLMPVIDSGPIP